MRKQIPIFFTIDDSYAPLLYVAIHSMLKHASKEYDLKIHIIEEQVSDAHKAKILSLGQEHVSIQFCPMKESLEEITDRTENHLRCDYFTMTIYFRLFIPEMFPQYDKAIYLDSDVIVPGDITKLYETDLQDHILGACPDHSVSEVPVLARYMEDAIGIDRNHYINSGVLLMNLKKMREKKLSEHFLQLLKTYHMDCLAPDQDYLNAMCYGDLCYLAECFDVMPNKAKQTKVEHPVIIHYNLFDKPWCYDGIQYEEEFWAEAKETEFYDALRLQKEQYGEEQKKSDQEAFARMLHKAEMIPDNANTFLKLYNNGVKIRL